MYPEEICEQLMTRCLAPDCVMGGLGGDNMTVVLICFLHNKPYDQLVSRCATSSLDMFEPPFSQMNLRDIYDENHHSSAASTVTATDEHGEPTMVTTTTPATVSGNFGQPRMRKEDSDDDDDDTNSDNEPDLK